MRAADAWAIERAGRALARPDGAGRHRPGPGHRGRGAVRAGTGGGGQGQQRRRRPGGRSAAARGRPRGRRARGGRPERPARRRPREPRAAAGRAAGAVRPRAARPVRASVVDALLGTGFEGSPREPLASAIAAINAQDAPVVACDVPSGVNASTGEVEGEAVRAAATATFHGPKVGLYVEPGKGHAGRGGDGRDRHPARGARRRQRPGLISERVLRALPAPARSGSKFASGVVVVAGGSPRPDRRADDGRALGPARRGGVRAGGGAGPGAARGRPAAARADEPRPSGCATASTRRQGVQVVEEMAERAGARGARARASAATRARPSSLAAWRAGWRRRCWSTPTA